MRQAGKGDKRRPGDQKRFEEKYLKINWGKTHVSISNPLTTTGFTIKSNTPIKLSDDAS
jgi:hypothetical protein